MEDLDSLKHKEKARNTAREIARTDGSVRKSEKENRRTQSRK